jgi:hypothetical protein
MSTKTTAIVITSQSQTLLSLCKLFIPAGLNVLVIDGRTGCYGLKAIVHVIENVPCDRVVLLDEDAFVLDANRLLALIEWSGETGTTCVGMSDGGIVPIRRHNPNVLNPFFNIIDLVTVRKYWAKDECLSFSSAGSTMSQVLPPVHILTSPGGYAFDDFEDYYCFYLWLHHIGASFEWLTATTHVDRISTLLNDHTGTPFLLHTWYARTFERSPRNRARVWAAARWAAMHQLCVPS